MFYDLLWNTLQYSSFINRNTNWISLSIYDIKIWKCSLWKWRMVILFKFSLLIGISGAKLFHSLSPIQVLTHAINWRLLGVRYPILEFCNRKIWLNRSKVHWTSTKYLNISGTINVLNKLSAYGWNAAVGPGAFSRVTVSGGCGWF